MILRILFVSFEIKGGTEQILSSLRENSMEHRAAAYAEASSRQVAQSAAAYAEASSRQVELRAKRPSLFPINH